MTETESTKTSYT